MTADATRKIETGAPTAWLSHGFEELVATRDPEPGPQTVDCDVVIVGSGYGGAIAAARLAGATDAKKRKISVVVLERGREYLPGMFPSRMSDLAGHVRYSTDGSACARGEREGLFDVRLGADVSALVANGLGGGSLINAGVMAEPAKEVFLRDEWPINIRNESWDDHRKRFAKIRVLLGAALADGTPNDVLLSPEKVPAKYEALKRMAKEGPDRSKPFSAATITVALTEKQTSSGGVELDECLRCGDCATGCNHGAKNSLDVNLLRTAAFAGATIYTGATVLRLVRHTINRRDDRGETIADDAWILEVVHTDAELRARQGGPFRLVARKVILAAGTFGSTEILLRSRDDDLVFSSRLGQRFSSNGDMIAVAYDQKTHDGGQAVDVNAIAHEEMRPKDRKVGPTITGIIDLRSEGTGVVIEEMAVPGPLRRLFEEVVTTGHTLRKLAQIDEDPHYPSDPAHDPCAVKGGAIRSSSILAVMGDDGAGGALELVGGSGEADGDGAIRVRWPDARNLRIFRDEIDALEALGIDSETDGEVQANPVWQLLPDDMQFLFDERRGPLMTVHPLGGCPMGDTAFEEAATNGNDDLALAPGARGVPGQKIPAKTRGVVNEWGQVFNGAPVPHADPLFRNLVVLDGSIVPTSLGINPSLTIAALAYRAIEHLRDEWKWGPPPDAAPPVAKRPVFEDLSEPAKAVPTKAEIIERMSGDVPLPARAGGTIIARVELTMCFKPTGIESLFLPGADGNVPMQRVVDVVPKRSGLRVFLAEDWHKWRRVAGRERDLDKLVQYAAPLEGSLAFMHREESSYPTRRRRALCAWIFNRGLRDIWQGVAQYIADWREGVPPAPLAPNARSGSLCKHLPFVKDACQRLAQRIQELKALASHAGEVRLFAYDLKIQRPDKAAPPGPIDVAVFAKTEIQGRKRLTYARRSNPWWQMTRMSLDAFPGLARGKKPVLELDTNYLTAQGAPLMRILAQQDEPAAIADLAAIGGYFLRLLLSIHVWSFRKPDPADPGEPQRLPGIVKGLPPPIISEICVTNLPDGRPVNARLTRYPRRASQRPPVLLIPGYSASGTTFAHPALDPHAAGYFWERGRDVWILDMRTSCGMPTARLPWALEDAALADIPAAVNYIWHQTLGERQAQEHKIDVLAHCMGSVMFSMAMLAPPESGDLFFSEREALPARIGRIVLSQIGPVVVFTPANIFRAYLMSYLRAFLPLANYEFRIGPAPSLTDQLIDRVLAAMPYPEDEFDIENPWWPPCKRTPWVGSRHRMDALYGRDFNVENVSARTLARDRRPVRPAVDGHGRAGDPFRAARRHHQSRGPQCLRHPAQPARALGRADSRLAPDAFDPWRRQWPLRHRDARAHEEAFQGRHGTRFPDSGIRGDRAPGQPHRQEGRGRVRCRGPVPRWRGRTMIPSIPASSRMSAFEPRSAWLGPLMGAPFMFNGVTEVPIAGAEDPALGKCFCAALVPVVIGPDGHFIGRFWIDRAAEASRLTATAGSHVSAPAEVWASGAEGVLLVLLYNQSRDLEYYTYQDYDPSAPLDPIEPPKRSSIRRLGLLPPMEDDVKDLVDDAINAAIEELLRDQPAKDLRKALAELPFAPAGEVRSTRCQPRLRRATSSFSRSEAASIRPRCSSMRSRGLPYARLSRRLDGEARLDRNACCSLGDQIYVDGTAGLFDPTSQFDRYVRPYELLYRMDSVRNVLRRLPAFMMMDDHEIREQLGAAHRRPATRSGR